MNSYWRWNAAMIGTPGSGYFPILAARWLAVADVFECLFVRNGVRYQGAVGWFGGDQGWAYVSFPTFIGAAHFPTFGRVVDVSYRIEWPGTPGI